MKLSSIVSFFTNTASTIAGGWQGFLIAGAVGAVTFAVPTWWITHNVEKGWRTELQLADAKFETEAVKLQADDDARKAKINIRDAAAEAYFQGKMDGQIKLNIQETPIYVTTQQDAIACVTVGFYRVLRASQIGASAGTLNLAPGQSDDDCADYPESALAGTLEKIIGIGNQNAEQLNSLEQNIRDQAAPAVPK